MKRIVIALALLIALSACSTKVSYYFLDWAIEWQLEDYVTLDRQQEQAFDAILDPFLVWHRSQELPRYSAQLKTLQTELADGTLTPQSWRHHVDMARDHWFRLFAQVFDDLLPLIASLSDKQVAQVIAKLEADEQELVDEYKDKNQEQLIKDADERLEELFADWLGRLSDQQKALIHEHNSRRLATLDMWLEYRHEWLRQFKQALLQRSDSDLLAQRLRLLMTSPDELKSDVHKQKLAQNTENFGMLLLQLHQSLSERQQKHFKRKLGNLIDDLDELSQASP
ncbi:DUF6279 family lipoprotein [Shewanella algae]|uniref:DUF6279 family lipoprotein n=1 Tax=Shewanella algae TaxID=38313 RepID=UPI000BB616AA|nr:DUF6279 family lipoprotein [Shewanella algae]MBO2612607.1 hypothetical protein [Shewanella algae]MBO2654416.1 hypothetical protein [Shewanella algae]MDC8852907.1 DUF6279 family lipoprotein [Shewanella algae]PBQ26396.1 hypothetical protein AYI97_14905 [Shewanella algae]QNH99523.1 hypothetical protein HU689_13590 [Shewanella algae]